MNNEKPKLILKINNNNTNKISALAEFRCRKWTHFWSQEYIKVSNVSKCQKTLSFIFLKTTTQI